MRYYFKDSGGGIGFSITQDVIGDVTWITEEEFNELMAAREEESSAELG